MCIKGQHILIIENGMIFHIQLYSTEFVFDLHTINQSIIN